MKKIQKFFKKAQADFLKVGRKEKSLILVLLIFSFILGLSGSFLFQKMRATFSSLNPLISPTPLPLPALLSFQSSETEVKTGATFSVILSLNSPNQGVEAADFVVNFDPKYLKLAGLEPGEYFQYYPVKTMEENFAKVSAVAALVNGKMIIPKGQGNVASLTFSALVATEEARLSFDKEKTVIASDGKNILNVGKLKDLVIKIGK